MPGQQWTNAELNKARKLKNEENKTLEEIAVILGKSYHSVRIKLGRVERQKAKFTENRKNNTAEVNAEVPRSVNKDIFWKLPVPINSTSKPMSDTITGSPYLRTVLSTTPAGGGGGVTGGKVTLIFIYVISTNTKYNKP